MKGATVTDLFAGCGGSSQGASQVDGVEIEQAFNHWPLAIDSHNSNFPNAYHECADISQSNPRRYNRTVMLIGSPECTHQGPSDGKKKPKKQLNMFERLAEDPIAERSRATMWDIPRFAEVHKYETVIVENVVEAIKWVMFDAWLMSMNALGYKHKLCFLNAMHFHPCPQSRDRLFVVFWKKGNKAPNLNYTPKAYCPKCEKDINSIQAFKPNQKSFKYKKGYVYCCPTDGTIVGPYYYAAFNCIDWNDLGEPLMGPRKRGDLSPNTIRRCQIGLDRYGDMPFMIKLENSKNVNVRAMQDSIMTQTTTDSFHFCTPMPQIIGAYTPGTQSPATKAVPSITTVDHNKLLHFPFIVNGNYNNSGKLSVQELHAQTTHEKTGVMFPFIVENKGQSTARPSDKSLSSITTNVHHGIVTEKSFSAFVSYYNGQANNSPFYHAANTFVANDRHALASYRKPTLEDCYYRSFKAHEVKRGMSFPDTYIIKGNSKEKVEQLGNAVVPEVMEWLVGQCVESLN